LKKEIYNHDLYYLVDRYYSEQGNIQKEIHNVSERLYELVTSQVISNDIFPSASVKLKCGEAIFKDSAVGDGPIDALYTAIKGIQPFTYSEEVVCLLYTHNAAIQDKHWF
jgi:2-isopropylmalate synthase